MFGLNAFELCGRVYFLPNMSNPDSDGGESKPGTALGTSSSAGLEPPSSKETEGPPRQPAEEALDEPDLLTQAREFLASPAILHQDLAAKRQFLLGKGLTPEDADRLLDETSVRAISHAFQKLEQ